MGFHDSDDMIEAITKQATKRTSSQVIKKIHDYGYDW